MNPWWMSLIVGMAGAAGRLMVYLAVATLLLLYPLATAKASIVVVVAIGIGAEYTEDEVVGIAPSVV